MGFEYVLFGVLVGIVARVVCSTHKAPANFRERPETEAQRTARLFMVAVLTAVFGAVAIVFPTFMLLWEVHSVLAPGYPAALFAFFVLPGMLSFAFSTASIGNALLYAGVHFATVLAILILKTPADSPHKLELSCYLFASTVVAGLCGPLVMAVFRKHKSAG
ncbi:MAG TPA: hypothetical protein VEA59_04100 [Patescibacteria group bacterium]|nr:hypothetical protein [Patescibacteria group bacterium]